jgi:hypothetical protein
VKLHSTNREYKREQKTSAIMSALSLVLLLALLCGSAVCSCFKSGVAQLPPPPRRVWSMCQSDPDLRPKPLMPGMSEPVHAISAADVRTLQTQVMRLERRHIVLQALVEDVCSALLHCDDVALMERHARSMGDIYLDTGFTTTRRPRMVRQEIMQIMNRHNVSDKPLMHTWKKNRFSVQQPSGEQDTQGGVDIV